MSKQPLSRMYGAQLEGNWAKYLLNREMFAFFREHAAGYPFATADAIAWHCYRFPDLDPKSATMRHNVASQLSCATYRGLLDRLTASNLYIFHRSEFEEEYDLTILRLEGKYQPNQPVHLLVRRDWANDSVITLNVVSPFYDDIVERLGHLNG